MITILTDEEARIAYGELLHKLRSVRAHELASEVERAIGVGRVRERERRHMQEPLPATSALEVALRMLAAWIEPAFLVSETEELLREATRARFDGLHWETDRLEVVESEAQVVTPPNRDLAVLRIPSLGAVSGEIRRHIERFGAIAKKLSGSDKE